MSAPSLELFSAALAFGFLNAGFLMECAHFFWSRERRWLHPASTALLAAGTAAAALTLFAFVSRGDFAFTASGAPVLLGWTLGVHALLTGWRLAVPRRADALIWLTWGAATALLWRTAVECAPIVLNAGGAASGR